MDVERHPDHDLLIRLDEKVNQVLIQLKSVTDGQLDHDKRLKAIEQWRAWMIGAGFAAGALGSLIVNWLKTRPL